MENTDNNIDTSLSFLTDQLSGFSFDSPTGSKSERAVSHQLPKRSVGNQDYQKLPGNTSNPSSSRKYHRVASDYTPAKGSSNIFDLNPQFASRIPVCSPAVLYNKSQSIIPEEIIKQSPVASYIPLPSSTLKISKKRVSAPSPSNSTIASNPKRIASKNLHDKLLSESNEEEINLQNKQQPLVQRSGSRSNISKIPTISHSSSLHSLKSIRNSQSSSHIPSYLQPTNASLRKVSNVDGKENRRSLLATPIPDDPRTRIRSTGSHPVYIEPQREIGVKHKVFETPVSNQRSVPIMKEAHGLKKSMSMSQDLKLSSMNSSSSYNKGLHTLSRIKESSTINSARNNTNTLSVTKVRQRPTSMYIGNNSVGNNVNTFIENNGQHVSRSRRDGHSQRISSKHKIQRNVSLSSTSHPNSNMKQSITTNNSDFNVSSLDTFPTMFSASSSSTPITFGSKQRAVTQPHKPRTQSIYESYENFNTDRDIITALELHPKSSKHMRTYSLLYNQRSEPVPGCHPRELKNQHPLMFDKLNSYEKEEIMRKKEVYFTGTSILCKANVDITNFHCNFGFDNEYKNYNPIIGDHINYRYQIMSILGKGAFGIVLACKDHKAGDVVAVKVIKNEMAWSLQAVTEVKMLKQLREAHCENTIEYIDHFHFRSHMCIVTDLMAVNLLQLIEATDYKGLPLHLIKHLAKDIATGLQAIHGNGMIHCDLKPENIMVQLNSDSTRLQLKIIDFGSSCNKNEISFSYLQSRFYRAPEVLLGSRYSTGIDVWSFAALIVELFTGYPLFPAEDEFHLLALFVELFGSPSRSTIIALREELMEQGPICNLQDKKNDGSGNKAINMSTLLWRAFSDDGSIDLLYLRKKAPRYSFRPFLKNIGRLIFTTKNRTGAQIKPGDPLLSEFIDMLNGCFKWDSQKRLTAVELLECSFLG